jgi:opacity protein-like surface antigen
MKKILALAVIVAACSTSVFAQNIGNLYGEAAYSMVSSKDTSKDSLGTFKPTAGRFTLGTTLTENVAVEGFLTQGFSDSSIVSGVVNVNLKMKNGYGFAVRPFLNISNETELFGRIGLTRTEAEATASAKGISSTASSKTTNTLYGVGLAYKITDDIKAIVDYTQLNNKDDHDVSMISIGLRYNFK